MNESAPRTFGGGSGRKPVSRGNAKADSLDSGSDRPRAPGAGTVVRYCFATRAPRGRTLLRAVVPFCARSYPFARGRTVLRAVVPFHAKSYLKAALRYDRAAPATTAQPRNRPDARNQAPEPPAMPADTPNATAPRPQPPRTCDTTRARISLMETRSRHGAAPPRRRHPAGAPIEPRPATADDRGSARPRGSYTVG